MVWDLQEVTAKDLPLVEEPFSVMVAVVTDLHVTAVETAKDHLAPTAREETAKDRLALTAAREVKGKDLQVVEERP